MQKAISKEYIFVMLAGILSGIIVFAGKIFADMGLSMYEISILPIILALVIFTPYVIWKKKTIPNKGLWPLLIVRGLISAAAVATQFAAVILGAPVAIVVLLLYTQPLWTLFITKLFLNEKVTALKVFASLIVLPGVVILANPFGISEKADLPGIIVALAGGLFLSLWIISGSVVSKRGNDPENTFFITMILMLIFYAVLYPLISLLNLGPEFTNFSFNWPLKIWEYILMFVLLTKIANHLFYLYGVKKVPTVDAGVIMLLEPVSGALLAALFLSEPITKNIIIGGAFILIANYLVLKKTTKSESVSTTKK